MNIQEELKELKERIAELEGQAKRGQEFPRDGDDYWYIDDEVSVFPTTYENHYMDRCRQTIGNVFKTEEQAEFAVEKLKVEAELRKFSRPFELTVDNFFIVYNISVESLEINCSLKTNIQGVIYFGSREELRQAVESVGEKRIKKYIFGVED